MSWVPSVSTAFEYRSRWTSRGPQRYTVRGMRGVARSEQEYAKCSHVHVKRGAALDCASALARDLNKETS